MQFNSLQFMIFFPVSCAVYFVAPGRLRAPWLLLCSYCFYMAWSPKYALLMAASTLATYLSGLAMQGPGGARRAFGKRILAACIGFNLAILGVFKYADMLLETLGSDSSLGLMLPVGISFYTFQALGYIIDVYRGDVRAERSLLRYALFVSFFPQLVAGPIERSKNLLPQVRNVENIELWDARRVTGGAMLMVWGFFLKMVISDRAAVLADGVWSDYASFGRGALLLASLAFTLQIYCDFGGYSMIAVGAAKILGFSLMENFNAPYFSCGIRDFWSRWHISLSTWFRDYLYIPLGGNRRGPWRRRVNLMLTFLVSGLWHGADWSFVLWGGIHGLGQLFEDAAAFAAARLRSRRAPSRLSPLVRFARLALTLAFVNFAWIFFRAPSVSDAFAFIGRMVCGAPAGSSGPSLGLDKLEAAILVLSVLVLLAADLIRFFGKELPDAFLLRQRLSTEWGIVIFLIVCIFVFGKYGADFDPKAFIYFQF